MLHNEPQSLIFQTPALPRKHGTQILFLSLEGWLEPSDIGIDEAVESLTEPDSKKLVSGLYHFRMWVGWGFSRSFDSP